MAFCGSWRRKVAAGIAVACLCSAVSVSAAVKLPPKPAEYVEDQAGILSVPTRRALIAQLKQFERDTSNQVLVATYPNVPADFQLEDFTQRTAESWGVGQAQKNNGAVLFIFPQSRKMRIEVGYGLEAVIPDALAKRILDNEVRPAFRSGDFNAGVTRGVAAILAAARGEYKGTGTTVAQRKGQKADAFPVLPLIFFLILLFLLVANRRSFGGSGAFFGPGGRSDGWSSPNSSWGGGGGGGGSFGGGGGGFDGGGGSFGGGGASGGW